MIVIAPMRKPDSWGSGEFGAKRGARTHQGVDFACAPGSIICSLTAGIVTKIGYPYADDLSYKYVQVTDALNRNLRYFYVIPLVKLGDSVQVRDYLGLSQSLSKRYQGITEHIHFEIKKNDEYLNPLTCFPNLIIKEIEDYV